MTMNVMKGTIRTLAVAWLFGAAALANAGDIVSIDVLQNYTELDGGKTYPNPNNPHSIGEVIAIRIRLINYDIGRGNYNGHDVRSPGAQYPWELVSLSQYPTPPTLGLLVGGVKRDAVMVSCEPVQATLNNSQLYYTDLIFTYTVQPGDLAQPLRLRSANGGEATEADKLDIKCPGFSSHFYNVTKSDDPTDTYHDADFSLCDPTLANYGLFSSLGRYPAADGADEIGNRRADITLDGQAVYIKTIDFDSQYVDTTFDPNGITNVWRIIHQGSTTPTKYGNPSIVLDAAAQFEDAGYATMWVWTEDDSILTPVGNTQTFNGHKALPITISTGERQKSFVLKATGVEGEGAWIHMSSAPTNIYGTAGELLTKTVRRYVRVGARLKPSVSVTFGGNSWTQATATKDYMENDYPVEMAITLSETFSEDVTVTLKPKLTNDDGAGGKTNIDVFANHVIASAPALGMGNGWQQTTTNLTFAKDSEVEKFLYIYPLGATKDSTRNGGTGIEFEIEVSPASAAAYFTELKTGVFYVNAADPVLADGADTVFDFTAGREKDIKIPLDDACRNMRYLANNAAEVVVNGTNLYSVTWDRNDDTATALMEWTGLIPDIDGNLTLTGVRYPNDGTYNTSRITITSPDGRTKVIPITANVSVPNSVTAIVDRNTYDEGETAQIGIQLSKRYGDSLYAFIEPLNEAASNCLSSVDGVIIGADGKATGQGILVPGSDTDGSRRIELKIEDGPSTPEFQIVLCSQATYDSTKVVDFYTPTPVTFNCRNVMPVATKIEIGGTSLTNGQVKAAFNVPADNAVSLKLTVNDVKADLKLPRTPNEQLVAWTRGQPVSSDVSNNLFIARWDFYDAQERRVDTLVTLGTGNKIALTNYTFTSIGDNQVSVRLLDKDKVTELLNGGTKRDEIVKWWDGFDNVPYGDEYGYWETMISDDDWGPEFLVTVPVVDRPFVTIEPENPEMDVDGNIGYREGTTSKFNIKLSTLADRALKVKVWVERTSNTAGVTKDIPTLGSFVVDGVELGQDTNKYVEVVIRKNNDSASVQVDYIDGTPYSRYRIHADVEPSTSPKDTDLVFVPGTFDFSVFNLDPKLKKLKASVGMSWNSAIDEARTNTVQVSQNQEITIEWEVQDFIRMDETNNLEVTWSSSEPGSTVTKDTTSGTYVTRFSQPGEKTIILTIQDKDGGTKTYEWYFFVEASKRLFLYPHKPNNSALTTAVADSYLVADGIGVGAVEASGRGLSEIRNFRQRWDYSVQTPSATIYARGLKAGAQDNKVIANDPRVGYPTQSGGLTKTASQAYKTTGVYTNFDSYVYAFINNAQDEQGGNSFTATILKIQPQFGDNYVEQAVTLPQYQDNAVSYPDKYVEIIYSREWRAEDNLGDINADGVPDYFARKRWKGGKLLDLVGGNDAISLLGGEEIGSDLRNLASSNPDEDYLPGVYSLGSGVSVNGYGNSYAPNAKSPFTTRTELRGFDLGLNAQEMSPSSNPSFSDAEWRAWTNWLYTVGIDTGTAPDLELWTPEPGSSRYARMDPTLADTDGDGFPDGWEYYLWYMAKVWVPAHKQQAKDGDVGVPRKGQFYVFERFNVNNIVKGDEIPVSDVMDRFDPCSPYNPERFKGAKHLKNDFDGDGLSDLEELLIGTNPTHWDTDGDRLCDGWEVMMCLDPLNGSKDGNPDGDYMAFRSVYEDVCWIDPDTVDQANFDANGSVANKYAENLRIYGLPGLTLGVDYALDYTSGKYLLLQNIKVVSYSFTPKYLNGENLVYGVREDIPNPIPKNWIWGWYMVDLVMCEEKELEAGSEVYLNLQYVLIHDQVRDGFGFDPRTGWHVNANGYVTDRWDHNFNPQNVTLFDETGRAVNTRPYANYDEYLVMKYRMEYGIDYTALTSSNPPSAAGDDPFNPDKETVWDLIRRKTTNPNVVHPTSSGDGDGNEDGDGDDDGDDDSATATLAARLAEAFNRIGSNKSPITTHGADTDQDGVPDGWELYMFRTPNAAPNAAEEDGLGKGGARDFDNDSLSWVSEYAGTDSCEAYKGCESIYRHHPGKASGWFNKFFPTNPGTMKQNVGGNVVNYAERGGNADGADTDLDGVDDSTEGGTWGVVFANGSRQRGAELGFIYGTPEDDGRTVCFRGGGMNPCTIDTDLDGIPDGWEMQHAGVPVQLPDRTIVAPRGGSVNGLALDSATFVADGINDKTADGDEENAEEAEELPNVVYIAGGMDATWKGDAVFDEYSIREPDSLSWDELLKRRRDVDFDHDGMQNYQEYLTQAVRHFRYDDITTPLMGRQLEEGKYDPQTKMVLVSNPHTQSFGDKNPGTDNDDTGTGYPVFDPADPETFAANAVEAWNGRSFVYYETVTTGVRDVVKVIDAYTGATETTRIYYTARKKRFDEGAILVAKHVANGGEALQYAWDVDGWRQAGYFAPPRREWDRAIASGKLGDNPLYMYPITDGFMVGLGSSVAGYATTDPRISDTDGDGLDDFYEMYHGLNPLLGTTPANAAATMWVGSKYGDIVSAQFYMANASPIDSRPTFNAWYNEWVYPMYSGLLGRAGAAPGDEVGHPVQAPMAYDPVLYPWSMGTPLVDADGDGIRNEEERLLANVADPVARHTDPTPLWMTERTTPASYVAQYYNKSDALSGMPWVGASSDGFQRNSRVTITDATKMIYFAGLADYWFSFEENEGYDTDGDMTPDTIEVVSTVRKASDPLRFDDPDRNQALYLPGENAYAVSRDLQLRPIESVDFLKQFTVECWVMPEKTGAAQTIVDRTVAYEGDSINTDKLAIRSNFRIGLDAQGKVYGMFDNSDSIESGFDAPRSCQFVDGGVLPLNKWSHIALTFDGSTLVIYVNGIVKHSAPTSLIPANGVSLISQNTESANSFPSSQYACEPSAFLIGARPKKQNIYALHPYYIEDGVHMESFDNLQEYFQGYVDEVRVWDGARTGAEILANYRKAMGFKEASENREAVFESWFYSDGTRNSNDGKPTLPAELVLNYGFSTLPGAVDEIDVVKTPAGFTRNVLEAAMSDYISNADIDTTGLYPNLLELKGSAGDGSVDGDLLIGWWTNCLVHSTVYDDYHVVPWIKNTVSHLPLMDGGAVDSFMYAEHFGSVYMTANELGVAKLVFPNTSMPYPSTFINDDMYYRLAHANILVERRGDSFRETRGRCRFQVRNSFAGTADLVPMGGAYAKTSKVMWDGNPSDPWEQTGDDTNGDGIPDWWEEYARHNYALDLDPSAPLSWETLVDYHGVMIPAGKAYAIDIFRGMQPDGTIDPEYAVNTDSDGDNMPDWWENLFGVAEYGTEDDPDGDGLSNYTEYLLSFGPSPYGMERGFPFLYPDNQRSGSGQKVTDYYLAGPTTNIVSESGSVTNVFANQYLGEIATDHDFMETWWEKTFANSYANAYVYDPDKDTDGDGWDNFGENRAATWYGTLLADSITRYLSDQVDLDNYPKPALGLRFSYNGIQDVVGKSVVVRTMTKSTGRTDAIFRIAAPGASETGAGSYVPGAFIDAKTPIHGFLQPGSILPQSCYVYGVHLSKDGVYYWGISQEAVTAFGTGSTAGTWIGSRSLSRTSGTEVKCWYCMGSFENYTSDVRSYGRNNVILDNPALDFDLIGKAVSRDDGRMGDVKIINAQTEMQSIFGSVNFLTGEFTLDPAPLATAGLAPDGMLVKVEYNYSISTEWSQTLWFNRPSVGRVKQGLNIIEAWMDLNGDGAYTAGEPYGMVRNVNVGWHKTVEAVIELKDTSSIIPHYLLSNGSSDRAVVDGAAGGVSEVGAGNENSGANASAGGLSAKIAVRRVGINGRKEFDQKSVPVRTLVSKSYILDDRAYITEADVLTDDKFDLDWKWLASDAEKLGLTVYDINSAEYEISRIDTLSDSSVTNVPIATFVNRFSRQRPVPVSYAPSVDNPAYSASPTFSWLCSDDTMTAFRLQVSTSTNIEDVVYDSGVKLLPGRDALAVGVSGYSFAAPIYVGAPVATNGAPVFIDGSNYFWRVTEFNAKYKADEEDGWSKWTQFQMDVANGNINPRLPTGYGKCGAVVRYYGANTNDLTGLVVVEAHRSADFTGQPLAQMRADVLQLGDRDDLETVNAAFVGIDPGTVYLTAYVDANNNGKRDVSESWGYANYVGTASLSIFTPQGVEVTDEIQRSPSVVIYIEDTDYDRNEIPDCIEDAKGADGVGDGDRDGLLDDEEEGYTTDPAVWDTDDDGMPDGWEVKFADLDPNFDDAEEVADGDVMAFALKDCTIVTVLDTNSIDVVNYILKEGQKAPTEGDLITGYRLYKVYEYPVVENGTRRKYYGRGVEFFADDSISNRVIAVASDKVALVHSQVYEEYGFNPRTANSAVEEGDRVNTKAFTALDKYLLIRYFAALGFCDEDDVNVNRKWAQYSLKPNVADGDWVNALNADKRYGDGVSDGWELYTGKNPWDFDDRESDDDGDGLPLYREFDAGNMPTDPWNIDTDGDGVFDAYAYCYHLKGDQAGADPDGDGLSNYAEYLISEVFQLVKLDPDDPTTDDLTLDYYRKFGELYVGEVFTDHDRVNDIWEAQYERGNFDGIDYAARGIYDPDADLDNDGWGNYAEYRAGTSPAKQMSTGIDDFMLIDHPVPVVEMEVVYNGTSDIEGKTLVVKAWNEALDPDALSAPIARWKVTTLNENDTAASQGDKADDKSKKKYIGRMPTGKRTYYLGSGAVKEGSFKLYLKDKNWVEGTIVTVDGEDSFLPTKLGDADNALWFYNVIDQNGKLVTRGGKFADGHTVGSIDYDSGRVTIDFDDKEFTNELFVGDSSGASGGNGNNGSVYHGLHLADSYVLFSWSQATRVPVRGIHYLGDTDDGFLRGGPTTFVVEAKTSSDGDGSGASGESESGQNSSTFNKAHIYGVVRHVDVGWAGAKFKVELTDFNPMTSRIDLQNGTFDRAEPLAVGDSRINVASDLLETATAQDSLVRVRVVRYAINGYPVCATWGADLADTVYDKVFSADVLKERLFCELDFLGDGMFDIDWTASFTNKVVHLNGETHRAEGAAGNIADVVGYGQSVTNMQYLVVVGDGDVVWERNDPTNVVAALPYLITRRFGSERATPKVVSVNASQYSSRPTFKWYMDGEEDLVKRFGSSYTAFKLRVNKGNNVVYESEVLRAPATDADGYFTWTAPICAGSIMKNGQSFDTAGSYSWQVSMYNAKYRSDSWSEPAVFSTAVNAQQEVNDHGYSSIAVAVKYAGPSLVLGKCANLTTPQGKVITQAFSKPDFSDDPLAQGMATNDVDELTLAEANAWLKGLSAIGTYYVRAFIDMDGDGKLSEWEPWGYSTDEVTLVNDGTLVKAPLVSVWIEDSDSDGDWIPDAYEYAAKGWTTSWETFDGNTKKQPGGVNSILPEGGIVLTLPSLGALKDAAISRGLPGASVTAMQSPNFVAAIMGITNGTCQTTLEAIAEATRGKIVTNSVKVVAISLEPDGSAVNLSVGADIASGIAGSVVAKYYQFAGSDTVTVNIKVLRKDSLSDATWTEAYTTTTTLKKEDYGTVVVPVDKTKVDLKSGFFKLEID